MAESVRVFVSHHHSPEEDRFTAQMVRDLKAAGARIWLDVADIGAGDFQDRINAALADCEWVVFVLTREALASPWVRQEINAAIRLKNQGQIRDIIPIQAGSVNHQEIPPLWGVFNIFDATREYGPARDGLLRAIGLSDLVVTPPSQPSLTPQPAMAVPHAAMHSPGLSAPAQQPSEQAFSLSRFLRPYARSASSASRDEGTEGKGGKNIALYICALIGAASGAYFGALSANAGTVAIGILVGGAVGALSGSAGAVAIGIFIGAAVGALVDVLSGNAGGGLLAGAMIGYIIGFILRARRRQMLVD